jgi:stage III sporulation protein AD
MEEMPKLLGIAFAAAVLTITVKKQSPELGMLVSTAGCILAASLIFPQITTVFSLLYSLADMAGIHEEWLKPILKVLGIGIVTKISASVCADAGQTSLAGMLEIGGSILSFCAAAPLLKAIIKCIEELL